MDAGSYHLIRLQCFHQAAFHNLPASQSIRQCDKAKNQQDKKNYGAEVDPFNYEIKKVSDGIYEIYGSYDNENGVKQHYVALAMDDGTSKVEILQLVNQN